MFFAAIAEAAKGRSKVFYSKAFANTVWAFAAAGHTSPKLVKAIAEVAESRFGYFKSHILANIVWAFTIAGLASPALECDCRGGRRSLERYKSQRLREHSVGLCYSRFVDVIARWRKAALRISMCTPLCTECGFWPQHTMHRQCFQHDCRDGERSLEGCRYNAIANTG